MSVRQFSFLRFLASQPIFLSVTRQKADIKVIQSNHTSGKSYSCWMFHSVFPLLTIILSHSQEARKFLSSYWPFSHHHIHTNRIYYIIIITIITKSGEHYWFYSPDGCFYPVMGCTQVTLWQLAASPTFKLYVVWVHDLAPIILICRCWCVMAPLGCVHASKSNLCVSVCLYKGKSVCACMRVYVIWRAVLPVGPSSVRAMFVQLIRMSTSDFLCIGVWVCLSGVLYLIGISTSAHLCVCVRCF